MTLIYLIRILKTLTDFLIYLQGAENVHLFVHIPQNVSSGQDWARAGLHRSQGPRMQFTFPMWVAGSQLLLSSLLPRSELAESYRQEQELVIEPRNCNLGHRHPNHQVRHLPQTQY